MPTQHGHCSRTKKSPTWWSWLAMRNRCRYPSNPRFNRYGGKGIKVCDRWQTFENFLADMGERPPDLTIDRLDSSKDYEPGNCRWATKKEQARHARRLAKFNGQMMSRGEIAAALGITTWGLRWRLRHGLLMLEDA